MIHWQEAGVCYNTAVSVKSAPLLQGTNTSTLRLAVCPSTVVVAVGGRSISLRPFIALCPRARAHPLMMKCRNWQHHTRLPVRLPLTRPSGPWQPVAVCLGTEWAEEDLNWTMRMMLGGGQWRVRLFVLRVWLAGHWPLLVPVCFSSEQL